MSVDNNAACYLRKYSIEFWESFGVVDVKRFLKNNLSIRDKQEIISRNFSDGNYLDLKFMLILCINLALFKIFPLVPFRLMAGNITAILRAILISKQIKFTAVSLSLFVPLDTVRKVCH